MSAPSFLGQLLVASWWLLFFLSQPSQSQDVTASSSATTTSSPSDLQCLRSNDPLLEQRLRLEAMKHEILLRLGFSEPPPNPSEVNPDTKKLEEYHAAKTVNDLTFVDERCAQYTEEQKNKVLGAFFPKRVEERFPIIHPSDEPPTDLVADTYRLQLDLDVVKFSDIKKAELRFYQIVRPGVNLGKLHHPVDRVEVYYITRPDNYYGSELRQFVTGLFTTPDKDKYVSFNVTDAIISWIYDHPKKIGELELEVWIRCPEGLKSGVMFMPNIQFSADNSTTQLVLSGFEEERLDKRSNERFTTEYCEQNPTAHQCCLRPLEINFERDLNWTWILEPKSIPFNYCKGSCPHNWNFFSRHSETITQLRRNNPTAAPEPCCVANSYANRTILTRLEGKDSIHELVDIVVKSCVCK